MDIPTSLKNYFLRHFHNFQRFKVLKEQASQGIKPPVKEKVERQIRTASLFFTSVGGANLLLGLATSGLSLSLPALIGATSLILGDDFTTLAKKLETPSKTVVKIAKNYVAQKLFKKKETNEAFLSQLPLMESSPPPPSLNRKQKALQSLKKFGKSLTSFGKKKPSIQNLISPSSEKSPSLLQRLNPLKKQAKPGVPDEGFVFIPSHLPKEPLYVSTPEKPTISRAKIEMIAAAKKEIERDTTLLKLISLSFLVQILTFIKKHSAHK